jgi:hypothetical protein
MGFLHSHLVLFRMFGKLSKRIPTYGSWWALNVAILEHISADCREAGVPVLFVQLPEWDAWPFVTLANHLRCRNLDFIDLGTLDPAGTTPRIHFAHDGHLNAEGHRDVAASILKWLHTHHPDVLLAPQPP